MRGRNDQGTERNQGTRFNSRPLAAAGLRAGARYSPDLNPIEMIGSKVKGQLRSIAARTADALHDAFGRAFAAVNGADVLGCFRHCGHDATPNRARL